MAGPITQELTATLEAYVNNKAVDQIFKQHAFWFEATRDNRMKVKTGGERLRVGVNYAKNDTVDAIGKAGRIPLREQDILSAAEYNWKLYGGSVTLYKYDLLRNRGETEMLDIMQENADNVISAFREELLTDTFATSQGANALLNLQSVFRNTGAVGGIDPATYTWWAAYHNDTAEPLTMDDMRTAYYTTGGSSSGPTLPKTILTSQTLYEKYESLLQPFQRGAIEEKLGQAGFTSLRFANANVIFDEQAISDEMWFINWDALCLYVQPEFRNGPKVEPFAELPDQLGMASKVWWMGQWGVKERRRLGCLNGRTA